MVSTDAEMSLPAGTVNLTATFTKLTDAELAAQGITPVRINEVSADDGIYVNEYYKRKDWVELYNTTNEPIDVEGMYLTDNPDKPKKYQISKGNTQANTVIPAHGHLIIWCDKEEPLSQLHASFKIDADGDELQLMAADESWTDRFVYPAHKSDQTVGRYPDGGNQVYVMNVPTIDKSNIISSYAVDAPQPTPVGITDLMADASQLSISYQGDELVIQSSTDENDALRVNIVNMAGQTVAQHSPLTSHHSPLTISVAQLPAGVYVATVTDSRNLQATCKFVKR